MSTVDTTTSPTLQARTDLAADLADATGYDVYLYGSATLATPCVVIEPNGWAIAQAAGSVVAYTVNLTCLYNSDSGSLDGAEEMARNVYIACRDLGWVAPEVPAPSQVNYRERAFVGVQFTAGTRITL